MWVAMRRLAWVLLSLSCGARTDLGGTHGADAGSNGTCSPAPAAPKSCTSWVAGTPQAIATGALLGDAVASGCGVLVAFHTTKNQSIAWSTRWVDFDGAMLAPSVAHPSLDAKTVQSADVSLAEGAMLEDDETGCHFMMIDGEGHETDTMKSLGGPGCRSLAHTGTQWSFLRTADGGGGASLVVVDQGYELETPLVFSSAQYVWDRVVFGDGSFLVSGFWEDEQTATYTNWLTPFDVHGGELGSSVAVFGFESAPVLVARAGDHTLAAWQWTDVSALSVGKDGQPLSLVQNVTTDSPIYDLSLFAQPNGDVLFAWIVLDEQTNDFSLHARIVTPDGMPRGPATLLSNDVTSFQVHGAIESTNARALLTLTTKDGTIEALPLTCQ